MKKICGKCGIEKDYSEFDIAAKRKDGRWRICKDCRSTSPEYHAKIKEKEFLFKKGELRCYCCGEVKPLSLMLKSKQSKFGYVNKCNKCNAQITKERQKSESYKKWRKDYEKTIDWTKYYPQMKVYRKNNRPKLAKTQREYRNTHVEVKLKGDMRAYTRLVLIKSRVNRSGSYASLLGCDGDFLRKHLESLFTDGMTWENYGIGNGKWNMDHIIHCAYFNLNDPEQQHKCFHWSNIQPMWAKPNMSKGSLYNGKRHFHDKRNI